MKVAIHQSQYLPWPPYFKKIANVDIFVVMDCVQFQKNGLQNRNKIRNYQKDYWLTIPVSGKLEDLISEKKIASPHWKKKHWNSIHASYSHAPMWTKYGEELAFLYNQGSYERLIDINRAILDFIVRHLQIQTKIIYLSQLEGVTGEKSELVLNICKRLNARTYVSGMGARAYLNEDMFAKDDIQICYLESTPPTYKQFHGDFIPGLSMLDMMMNVEREDIERYLFEFK
ncbi:MAG: WbqC family protein [Brevibacillus sp.]|nr:WbqC family protein [Brevibacillus sp.]